MREMHFIGSSSRISALQRRCIVVAEEVDQEGVFRQYLCTLDGSVWNYYCPAPDGYPKCEAIMVRNHTTLQHVMTCILEARHTHEIAVACVRIRWQDYERIVEHLEKIVSTSSPKSQLKNVARTVVWSNIDTAYNHFGSQGKTRLQIEADYAFFKDLAARATTVRQISEERIGMRFSRRVSWK